MYSFRLRYTKSSWLVIERFLNAYWSFIGDAEVKIELLLYLILLKNLQKVGFTVIFEKGAGIKANYLDKEYSDAGATLSSRSEAMSSDILI